jgi:hypothetical protein
MKRAVIFLALAGCDDLLDQRLAIVDEPRVLAVIAEPPEAEPGVAVDYSIVVAGPDGPVTAAPQWAYCTAPKAPTEDNSVSAGCFGDGLIVPLGTGPTASGPIPMEACLSFGGDTKPGGFRPRDPDPTGGFYQPVRAIIDGELAFGLTRILCKLPNVAPDISVSYDRTYATNTNPTLEPLTLTTVPADSDVELVARWPAGTAEPYVFFDRGSQQLIVRRESLRLSWFATAGTLPVDATAVGESDPATEVRTTWHTPSAGPAWLYLVLRDSRGGIAVQSQAITVQ